jgi:DHA2 family multidrug resistance protein-like MFS transporter
VGLGALTMAGLVVGLDMTILVTALPTLSVQLGATTSQLQWISAAYILTLAVLLLPSGVLGDRLGRRRLLLFGLLLFGVSSIVASQVTSANGLILMRALMGMGAAVITPLGLSVLPSMFTTEERPRAVALSMVASYLGLPLGPLVAGWLLTHFAWGSIFLINAPVVVLALLGVWFLVPESRDPQAPGLDWLGAVLAMIGVTGVTYGIVQEPEYGWTDARVLTALLGGAVVLAAFVAQELQTTSPLVDLRLFLKRRFTWSAFAFVVVGFVMSGVLFVLSPYVQIVQGNDAMGTGIRMLPMIGALILGSGASGRLTQRLGTNLVVAGGLLLTGAGMLLLSRLGAGSGYGLVAAALIVGGLGVGLAMPPAVDAMLGTLPRTQTGSGMGLAGTVRQVAAAFGVAILGSILNSGYRGRLSGQLTGLPAHVQTVVSGSVAAAAAVAHHLPGRAGDRLLHAAYGAYAGGMADVMLVCAAVAIVGAVVVGFLLPAKAESASHADDLPEGSTLPKTWPPQPLRLPRRSAGEGLARRGLRQ